MMSLSSGIAALLLASLSAPFSAASPLAWDKAIEIARGPGEKGPWEQNDSRYRYVDDPAVSFGDDGSLAIAWVDQARKDVFFQRLMPDGSRTPAINLSNSGATFSWLPRLRHAPDGSGKVYALWQEIIFSGGSHGGDILFARSDDGGRSFTPPVNLSASVGGDGKGRINATTWHNGSQDVAAGPDGMVYAVWTEYEGTLWFSRSTDGGKRFSPPRAIAGERGRPARAPSLAVGKGKTVYLAWTYGEDDGADIHLARSDDGGERFSEPLAVAPDMPNAGYADAPKIAVAPDGGLHLAYALSNGGPFGKYRVLATRSADGGRSFDAPRDVSSAPSSPAAGARFPYLGIDASGRIAIAYELYHDRRARPRGLGLSVSFDGGRSFSSPAEIPDSAGLPGGTNGSQQGWLMEKLAMGKAGDIAVVNSSLVEDSQSRVWLVRGRLTAERSR